MKTLIKDVRIVNEGKILEVDVLVSGKKIEKIGQGINAEGCQILQGKQRFLLPGVIDDQVHFREPGLTHKGDMHSESKEALKGGVTTFFEQPNTIPQTTTIELLEKKFEIAKEKSFVNYSFFLAGTNNNIEELKKIDKTKVAGVKLFLGSSTGNMLVDDPVVLENIFGQVDSIIAAHCEDEKTIRENTEKYTQLLGERLPAHYHSKIRSQEACYISSSQAVRLAREKGTRLHVFHVSTEKELELFDCDIPLEKKKITAEACVHHLWFCDRDYSDKGYFIKWNPAIKTENDREALWSAIRNGKIDVIATDHAPHTLQEKQRELYKDIPSGGPLIAHSLVCMLQCVEMGKISIEKLVQMMCHNPATLFRVKDRGFIREGYFADLVLIEKQKWMVTKQNIGYKCGWSPFEGQQFDWRVCSVMVNGQLAYDGQNIAPSNAERVEFDY